MLKRQKCSGIHCGRGVNWYHQGMIDKAIDAYQEILQQSTSRFRAVYFWLGIAYFHKKMMHEAVQTYRKFLDIEPEFNIGNYHLEICSFCSELTSETINLFEQVLKENSNHALAYYHLGVAYYYKGNLDKSIEQIVKASEINRKNHLYSYNLTELKKIRKRFYE